MPQGAAAVGFLRAIPLGTRVVVRRREPDGFRDALGYLRARTEDSYSVETRQGLMTLPWATVTRAKTVPEPPPRSRNP